MKDNTVKLIGALYILIPVFSLLVGIWILSYFGF